MNLDEFKSSTLNSFLATPEGRVLMASVIGKALDTLVNCNLIPIEQCLAAEDAAPPRTDIGQRLLFALLRQFVADHKAGLYARYNQALKDEASKE